jgi:hypothetical protein
MARKKQQREPEQGFDFAKHERVGEAIKFAQESLDKVKAELNYYYPESGTKAVRMMEAIAEKILLVQAMQQARLYAEFPEKENGELLPVYSGRPRYLHYRTAPKTDETAESDTQHHEPETDPLQPDVESLPSNGSSDLVVDQEVTADGT